MVLSLVRDHELLYSPRKPSKTFGNNATRREKLFSADWRRIGGLRSAPGRPREYRPRNPGVGELREGLDHSVNASAESGRAQIITSLLKTFKNVQKRC